MKIEVRCTRCERAWLVDAPSGGAELLCPSCMNKIELDRPRPAAKQTAPAPVAAKPVVSVPAKVAVAPPKPTVALDEDVVCPRCKLHFSPHGKIAEAPLEKKTVLIVEDLEYFREIAAESLSSTYDVKTATTSAEARRALTEGEIDLIVLDLTLEVPQAGRHFLAELNPKPCPILIFTAQDESELYGETWDELTGLGADDVVFKGMHVEESLARKVGQLLGTPLDDQEPVG